MTTTWRGLTDWQRLNAGYPAPIVDEIITDYGPEVGFLRCYRCGHPFAEHGADPPYTGAEWCEGAGSGEFWWDCPCTEFE